MVGLKDILTTLKTLERATPEYPPDLLAKRRAEFLVNVAKLAGQREEV